MVFFLVRVLFVKQGTFKSQHIHDSEAMKERGIHCVMDQDREMRQKSKFASLWMRSEKSINKNNKFKTNNEKVHSFCTDHRPDGIVQQC